MALRKFFMPARLFPSSQYASPRRVIAVTSLGSRATSLLYSSTVPRAAPCAAGITSSAKAIIRHTARLVISVLVLLLLMSSMLLFASMFSILYTIPAALANLKCNMILLITKFADRMLVELCMSFFYAV